ncbi:hypothetical protein ACR777_15160 [Sphingobacterium spiritivorum]|uniref:hypothetical protein n=1 Tax=Sphingobacterium spiritivorum TaxID=258 RepID=UPI003DA6B994
MGAINILHQDDNIGGLLSVEIAHVTDFSGFNPVVFKPGKNFQKVDILPLSGSLKDDEEFSNSGTAYTYAGIFKIHHPTAILENAIRPYIGLCSVLKLTDLNGRIRIVGSPACPVLLKRTGDSGLKPSDMAHNEFKFSVTQPHPAI